MDLTYDLGGGEYIVYILKFTEWYTASKKLFEFTPSRVLENALLASRISFFSNFISSMY